MEGETCRQTMLATSDGMLRIAIPGAKGVTSILDNQQVIKIGERFERLGVLHPAAQMYRKHGSYPPAAPAQCVLDMAHLHQARVGVDIGEYHLQPRQHIGAAVARKVTEGTITLSPETRPAARLAMYSAAVPLLQTMECLAPTALAKRGIKGVDLRTGGEPIAAQHGFDGGNIVIFNDLPGIWQKAAHVRSRPSCFSRVRICSTFSHSLLLSLA